MVLLQDDAVVKAVEEVLEHGEVGGVLDQVDIVVLLDHLLGKEHLESFVGGLVVVEGYFEIVIGSPPIVTGKRL